MSGSSSCSELASDLLYSGSNPHGGPAGDSAPISLEKLEIHKKDFSGLSKADILKIKTDLDAVYLEFNKYNFEKISKQDLANLKVELGKFDMRNLIVYDLANIKSELQKNYNAELEILREDYENKIDLLNVENEQKIQNTERKYLDKIENLKFELDEALKTTQLSIGSTVQEVVSSFLFSKNTVFCVLIIIFHVHTLYTILFFNNNNIFLKPHFYCCCIHFVSPNNNNSVKE